MTSREFQRISKKDHAAIAEYLGQKPVPLGKVAQALGLRVMVSSLKPGISGLIENKGDYFEIRINRNESRERQRFTLAHEIAHFLLHRNMISAGSMIQDTVLYRSGQSERIEYEANRLAADLIMPYSLVKDDIPRLETMSVDEAVEVLASEWQVSRAALEIRLSLFV